MDKIYRGVLNKGKIRIFLADISDTATHICANHGYNYVTSDALSRVLAVASIMGEMQKMGKVTIKIDSNGPLKCIIVDCDNEGHIRGLVSNPNPNSKSVQEAVGNKGLISVIKDFGMKHNFSSQSELISGGIGDDFSNYFIKSEQVPSFVNVGTNVSDNKFYAGAMIIQLMPGYKEEDVLYVENFAKNTPTIKEILAVNDKIGALNELFPEIEILSESKISFKCTCSKKRFLDSLATLNLDELKDMEKDHKDLEVVCNFCNSKYVINHEEIVDIINSRTKN